MKFYIVVPVFNEEKTISSVVSSLVNQYPLCTIIIVNDGSSDNTKILLEKLNYKNLLKLNLPENRGKGAALKTGLDKILETESEDSNNVVIFFDSDLEIDSQEIKKVVSFYMERPNIDSVFGSRFLNNKNFQNYGFKFLINFLLTYLSNLITKNKLTDMETALKSFKVKYIRDLNLESERFDIEPEVVYKLSKLNIKIYEVPIRYAPRTKKAGKKMSIAGGLDTLKALIKFSKSN
jgi:glycosyltransferase involved in cell wall biosynthesis